ncbi:unnamed protein product [Sphagnum jensenii]
MLLEGSHNCYWFCRPFENVFDFETLSTHSGLVCQGLGGSPDEEYRTSSTFLPPDSQFMSAKVDDITVLTGNVVIAETILKPIPRAASAGLVDLSVDTTAGTRCGASKQQ